MGFVSGALPSAIATSVHLPQHLQSLGVHPAKNLSDCRR